MRILFLNPTGQVGGAETALLEVIAGLVDRYPLWQLGLIAASDGPVVSRARALGVDVRVLPFQPMLARFGEWSERGPGRFSARLALRLARVACLGWRYRSRLRRVIAEFAPDIVHSNGLKMHVLGAWAKPAGIGLVWHLHDYISGRPLSASALKRHSRISSAIIAPSRSVAEDFATLSGPLPPIHTIWNSVDLARFSPHGDRLDLDDRAGLSAPAEGVVRVGLVATLAPWKGHHIFLDAMARLPASLNVRAYVIGGGAYETEGSPVSIDALREAAARLGLTGRVGFTGFIDDPAPAIRTLDILVHASTDPEPFGPTVAEGMACGRAVVVSYGGGPCELVTPGVDALVSPRGDAAALARCIEELATQPALRQRLGHAGRATAERTFSRKRLVNELLDVYQDVAPGAAEPDMRLRVLHVHCGNLYGGVGTLLATLASESSTLPMSSSFALCFTGRLSDELKRHRHIPFMLGAVRARRPHSVWLARRALARILASEPFDVVVCHESWSHAIFGPTVRASGLPLVFWRHTVGDRRQWLERWARRLVPDLAVYNSQFTTDSVSRLFPDSPIEIIHCPVTLPRSSARHAFEREEVRRSLRTSRAGLVIVQVASFRPWKGQRQALEAMARLRDLGNWVFWMVGGAQRASEERYQRELEGVVHRHNLGDRVRFVGERRDVPALLQAADIYCQPNVSPEAFGLALVEAQGAGLPIVTSAIGGALEIVDEECGLLIPPHDIVALAAALRRLLCDPGLRARLGRAARVRAGSLCDPARQMRRTYDVLSGVVRRTRERSFAQNARVLESAKP